MIADKLTLIAENMQKVYDAGKASGGYGDGYGDGYADGEQKEYDAFWDGLQNNGSRTNYEYAFANAWSADAFKPKYDITIKQATCLFRNSKIQGSLGDLLDKCGVKLVWDSAATGNSVFYGSAFTHLPDIVATGTLSYFFSWCQNLETIDSIDVTRCTSFDSAFAQCTKLKTLTIVGDIKTSGLGVSASPLTHDSLMSIINALEKKTSGTFTVTLGATNLAKLTDAEKATATQKGWTLV